MNGITNSITPLAGAVAQVQGAKALQARANTSGATIAPRRTDEFVPAVESTDAADPDARKESRDHPDHQDQQEELRQKKGKPRRRSKTLRADEDDDLPRLDVRG